MEDSNWPTHDEWLVDVCNLIGWRDEPTHSPNPPACQQCSNKPEKPVFVGSWGRFHDCSSVCENITYELVCRVSKDREITWSDVVRSFPTYLYQLKLRLLSSRLTKELFSTCSHATKIYAVLILNNFQSEQRSKRAKVALKNLETIEFLDFLVYDVHKLQGDRALHVIHRLQELVTLSYEEYVILNKHSSKQLPHLLAHFKTYCHRVLYDDTIVVNTKSPKDATNTRSISRDCQRLSESPDPILQTQARVVKIHCLTSAGESEAEAVARLARKQEVLDQFDSTSTIAPLIYRPNHFVGSMQPTSSEEKGLPGVTSGKLKGFPVSRVLLQITRNLFSPYKNTFF